MSKPAKIETPAGILELGREAYDARTEVNWSTLKYMGQSPAHYRQALMKGRDDTAALKRGRVTHLAVFEPERFLSEVAVWTGGRRAGKEWEVFRAANEGRELVTEDEYRECLAISEAVRGHSTASRYVTNGVAERTLVWTDKETEIACRGRVDFIAACGAMADLKTCRDASPTGFGRAAHNLGHCAQAAFYSDGYEAITGERLPYVLVAVETGAPHVVQPYRIPSELLELGRETYRNMLHHLRLCRATNNWPGYAEAEMDLTLPRWAMPMEDEDLGEMGLELGAAQ